MYTFYSMTGLGFFLFALAFPPSIEVIFCPPNARALPTALPAPEPPAVAFPLPPLLPFEAEDAASLPPAAAPFTPPLFSSSCALLFCLSLARSVSLLLMEKNIGPSSASHSGSTALAQRMYSLLVNTSSW